MPNSPSDSESIARQANLHGDQAAQAEAERVRLWHESQAQELEQARRKPSHVTRSSQGDAEILTVKPRFLANAPVSALIKFGTPLPFLLIYGLTEMRAAGDPPVDYAMVAAASVAAFVVMIFAMGFWTASAIHVAATKDGKYMVYRGGSQKPWKKMAGPIAQLDVRVSGSFISKGLTFSIATPQGAVSVSRINVAEQKTVSEFTDYLLELKRQR